MIYINQSAINGDEREIYVKGQVITWDHLLEQQHEVVFHTFQTAVDCIEMLLPVDKNSGLSAEEVKKGEYFIKRIYYYLLSNTKE